MTTTPPEKKSQLIASLREGIAVVQMVLFKETKARLAEKLPLKEQTFLAMLAGSITNEIFNTHNPEKKFAALRQKNLGEIEQEIISLKADMPQTL